MSDCESLNHRMMMECEGAVSETESVEMSDYSSIMRADLLQHDGKLSVQECFLSRDQ